MRAPRAALQTLEKELAGLESRSADLTSRWSAEKNKLSNAQKLKSELDQYRNELAEAQRVANISAPANWPMAGFRRSRSAWRRSKPSEIPAR